MTIIALSRSNTKWSFVLAATGASVASWYGACSVFPEIGRDPRRPETVVAELGCDAGRHSATAHGSSSSQSSVNRGIKKFSGVKAAIALCRALADYRTGEKAAGIRTRSVNIESSLVRDAGRA
jgi:hypothetical protein